MRLLTRWVLATALVVALGVVGAVPRAAVSQALPAAQTATDFERIPTVAPVVALTFDAGASDAGVASILATLATRGVPATFFLTGDFARRYPARVAAIAAAGHRLGNHSDTHEHYPDLLNVDITADLARAEAAIRAAAGRGAAPLFRFPYGDRTSADIRAVNNAGYVPVRWTVDTLGWKGTSGGVTAAIVRQRVLDTARAGQIVLMHVGANPDDGTTLDADALPSVIDALRARGYSFVTLDALLAATSSIHDISGDGRADILARYGGGDLWLYPGNGASGWLPRTRVGTGWNTMTAIVGPGDFTGDGRADILARYGGGDLWLYPGNGASGWLPRTRVGTGWNTMTAIVGPGDFSGDGRADILARDATGALWLYPGNGASGWLPRTQVGTGWNTMTALV